MAYPKDDPARGVPASPDLPAVERRVLDFWASDDTFTASVENRLSGERGANEFVFYDGPPFANGLPHYGHLLTGYVKDVVPRHRTMKGRRVERRFGWDCHGLPAEVEAEKQLGITTKDEVIALGVDKFNAVTRESVLRYTEEWERYVTRQARWVDMEDDYKTLDLDYMESVMWAFKALHDKGLVYQGHRVLWYCPRCETPLSNTETKMDDVYRDRDDPAVTVALPLVAPGTPLDGVEALVWTTTPWTLPSNLAAAVRPDVVYAVVAGPEGRRFLLAEARIGAYAAELGEDATVLSRHRGSDLVGLAYVPPFDFFAGRENAHRVLPADYVTTDDGTGIVHIAPAFGEEDKVVTDAAGIEPVVPVDAGGRFTDEVPPYAGVLVFDANDAVCRDLASTGRLLRRETHRHSYPHCWRCDSPLMQRAVSSWFVAVTRIKDRMIELNRRIEWTPEHVRDGQFGKWLEGARDWSISRNRFWGSPIPVWVSDDPERPRIDVYGSLDELERDFGVRPTDLHRPYIDELTRPNPDDPTGRSTMRRVPEVLDCWFESGSMPFAQVHYPFENAEWFEAHHPGDFIVEYGAQTRGWFYTLHVLATALFDRPAFASCVVHGTLLGHDGQKMSKSRRNYPDVYTMFDEYGSDAMRWFLVSSPVLRGGDMSVDEDGIRQAVRQIVLPLWNVWHFFALYAGASGYESEPDAARAGAIASGHVLDRYVLAATSALVADVDAALEAYDIATACASVRSYVDTLTNWYVRRSRMRFWQGDRAAFDTLATVLRVLCETTAPLLPLVADDVWRGLTGGRSVHLADFPSPDELPGDPGLVAAMDAVRDVCSTALSLRKAGRLRVRLPLASLTIAAPDAERLRPFLDLVADEVNVRTVVLTDDVDAHCERTLSLVPRTLGPRLGPDVQRVIAASKSGDWALGPDGEVVVGGVSLMEGEFTVRSVPRHPERTALLGDGDGVVVLDVDVTPELAAEGVARDVVRVVQQARKDAGLAVTDRVTVVVDAPDSVAEAVRAHESVVSRETLADAIAFGVVADGTPGDVDGGTVTVAVTPL